MNLGDTFGTEKWMWGECGYDRVKRSSYFGDEVICNEEAIGTVSNLKNGISSSIDGITGKLIQNEGEIVIERILNLFKKVLFRT